MEIGDVYSTQLGAIEKEFSVEIMPTPVNSSIDDIAKKHCSHTDANTDEIIGTDRYDIKVKISKTDSKVYINLYRPEIVSEEEFPGDEVLNHPISLFQNTNMETLCKKIEDNLGNVYEERDGIIGIGWVKVDYQTNVPSSMSVSNFDIVWYSMPILKKRYSLELGTNDHNECYINQSNLEEIIQILT